MSFQAYLDDVQAKTGKTADAHVIRHGEVSETDKKKNQPKSS